MNKFYKTIGAIVLGASPLFYTGCASTKAEEPTSYESLSGNPTKQLEAIESGLDEIMKDGVINPPKDGSVNEIKQVKVYLDQAKSLKEGLKGDDDVSKALKTAAESLENRAAGYLTNIKTSDQVKSFYVFVRNEGGEAFWYFIEPGQHASIKGTPAEIEKALGVSADDLVSKIQYSLGENFGETPNRGLSQEEHDELKARVLKNAVRVPSNKLGLVSGLFADGKITDGNRTYTSDEYNAWGNSVIAGYIFTVATYKEGEKELSEIEQLKKRIEALEGKKEAPKDTPKDTPKETPKEAPKDSKGIPIPGKD